MTVAQQNNRPNALTADGQAGGVSANTPPAPNAFYTPTYTNPRPCHLAMVVGIANAAIIYPSGWTEPKVIDLDQLYMPDEVVNVGGSKANRYKIKDRK